MEGNPTLLSVVTTSSTYLCRFLRSISVYFFWQCGTKVPTANVSQPHNSIHLVEPSKSDANPVQLHNTFLQFSCLIPYTRSLSLGFGFLEWSLSYFSGVGCYFMQLSLRYTAPELYEKNPHPRGRVAVAISKPAPPAPQIFLKQGRLKRRGAPKEKFKVFLLCGGAVQGSVG